MTHYTIIAKRHPDGYNYVPFDDDPDAADHRRIMIGHLIDQGNSIEPMPGTLNVKINSGPLAA